VVRFTVPVVFPSELAPSLRSAKVVAIIPARYESTRLPGKPLLSIDGRPMIAHVHERASAARLVDHVIVATDDRRIADVVDTFGGVAVMTATSHATGTDRLAEVASHLDADIVVNVQGDEPVIMPESIDAAVRLLLDRPADQISTLRRAIDRPEDFTTPSVVKVAVDRDGYALYFTRASIPFTRPGSPQPTLWKHLGLYAYRRAFLLHLAALAPTPLEMSEGLEQLRALEHGFRIRTAETTVDTIGVDTPEDLERVRRLVGAPARS
jgi:3-deoxy-manno-octulosonate cytidylyltransferase (CMP-KDO synthetase)